MSIDPKTNSFQPNVWTSTQFGFGMAQAYLGAHIEQNCWGAGQLVWGAYSLTTLPLVMWKNAAQRCSKIW